LDSVWQVTLRSYDAMGSHEEHVLIFAFVGAGCRYEMRSPGFHEEVRRHNELLRQRPSWQQLFDYRTELEGASRQYRSSLTPHDEVTTAADDRDDDE